MSKYKLFLFCLLELTFTRQSTPIVTNGRNATTLDKNRNPVADIHELSDGNEKPSVDNGSFSALHGEANAFSMPKCCPVGQRLDSRLHRCEDAGVLEAAPPFRVEWLGAADANSSRGRGSGGGDGGGGDPRLACRAGDTLRLGAADAGRRVHAGRNGSLALRTTASEEVWLSREEFCADASAQRGSPWALLLCPCEHVVCFRKCCPRGQILSVREISEGTVDAQCVEGKEEEMWKPDVENLTSAHEVLCDSWPQECADGLARVPPGWADPPAEGKDIALQPNGSAVLGYASPLLVENFCVDFEHNRNGSLTESLVHCASLREVPLMDLVMSSVSLLGLLALLLVIATYALLAELRATAFGRGVMCYASSLLLATVSGLWLGLFPNVSNVRCVFLLTVVNFFQLAAAFWLNAMCWDMGLAFRVFRASWARGGPSAERRFIKYSIYAWCGPIIIYVVMIGMQLALPSGHPFRPLEWYMGCDFFTKTANFAFFYGPMLIVLLTNFTLLVYIAVQIRVLQRDTSILEESSETSDACPYTGKRKLLLYTRLLWAMGVVETTVEIVAFVTASSIVLWHVTNIVDLSRALCLLALVCCKQRVIKRLGQRIRFGSGRSFKNRVSPFINTASATYLNSRTTSESVCDGRNEIQLHNMAAGELELQLDKTAASMSDDDISAFTKENANSKDVSDEYSLYDAPKRKSVSWNQPIKVRENDDSVFKKSSIPRNISDEAALYAIPKRRSISGNQTVKKSFTPKKETIQCIGVKDPQKNNNSSPKRKDSHLSGSSIHDDIPDSPLELGDLSNSASNSPITKLFPFANSPSTIEMRNVDNDDVRRFRRSSSKVMNNPIFETNSTSLKAVNLCDADVSGPGELPEISVIDDEALVNHWERRELNLQDSGRQDNRSVSVTSL